MHASHINHWTLNASFKSLINIDYCCGLCGLELAAQALDPHSKELLLDPHSKELLLVLSLCNTTPMKHRHSFSSVIVSIAIVSSSSQVVLVRYRVLLEALAQLRQEVLHHNAAKHRVVADGDVVGPPDHRLLVQ